jgi:23S rRNA pseudouridine2605 synthase
LNWKDEESAGPADPLTRLQVFLARAGAASRRASEGLIQAGRVRVNGQIVTTLGTKVAPGDEVRLDGKILQPERRLHYLALNKPPGYLCSSRDPQGRPLALQLLPAGVMERLYSVGRLDYLSSGLVLFTNDGDFTARLSHPSSGVEKEYLVESTVPIPEDPVERFLEGVEIEGELYRAKQVERLDRKTLRVVLVEGKNREIRRVFSHFHLHPRLLRRVRVGPVILGTLPEGQSRPLTEREMTELKGKGVNRGYSH